MRFLTTPWLVLIVLLVGMLWYTSEAPAHQEFILPGDTPNGEAFSTGTVVNSGMDVSLAAQEVEAANAGRDVTLRGTTVNRNVAAGRRIQAIDCRVGGNMSAGQDAQLDHCKSVRRIIAGRNVAVAGTTVESSVEAGQTVRLTDANVEGDVKAGSGADVTNSRIGGTLYLTTDRLELDGSRVMNIRMGELYNMVAQDSASGIQISSNGNSINIGTGLQSNSIIGNNSIRVNGAGIVSRNGFTGNSSSTIVSNGMSNAMISVGPSSVSNVNGYTVKGASDQTTVLTPQGGIYVNGKKATGPGPKTYGEFLAQNPGAPSVQGPGWVSGGAASVSQSIDTAGQPEQVIELVNNSVIAGEVVFEGGNGKIIVHPGSVFSGEVRGGTVENR